MGPAPQSPPCDTPPPFGTYFFHLFCCIFYSFDSICFIPTANGTGGVSLGGDCRAAGRECPCSSGRVSKHLFEAPVGMASGRRFSQRPHPRAYGCGLTLSGTAARLRGNRKSKKNNGGSYIPATFLRLFFFFFYFFFFSDKTNSKEMNNDCGRQSQRM